MAGDDKLYDTLYDIEVCIEKKIRKLLENPLNEFQNPNWDQAARLFEMIVLPNREYKSEVLFNLASDIVKKAESVIDASKGNLIDPELNIYEYLDPLEDTCDSTIDNVKRWMKKVENEVL